MPDCGRFGEFLEDGEVVCSVTPKRKERGSGISGSGTGRVVKEYEEGRLTAPEATERLGMGKTTFFKLLKTG